METRNCQNCKKDFIIEPDDFGFYEKIKVPPPTFCPECRLIRRLSWRNEKSLYRNECRKCGTSIVSVFPKDSGINVFCRPCWWGDGWDGADYGVDFDFSKSFLPQLMDLAHKAPAPSLFGLYTTLENSEYTNLVGFLKNCYLITHSDYDENCMYGSCIVNCKDCVDNSMLDDSELCYENMDCQKCYQAMYSVDCANCRNIYFCQNCVDCSDCFGCNNLRNQKYHIFNQPYTREEYQKKLSELGLNSYKNIQELKKKSLDFWKKFPKKYMHERHNTGVSGDYIYNSKNTHNSFIVADAEDCKFCSYITSGGKTTDAYDFTHFGLTSDLLYESLQVGEHTSNVKFSFFATYNTNDMEYSIFCTGCKNCFGCVGLHKKQYHIFNKPYSKTEYEKLVKKIKAHMDAMPYVDKQGLTYKYGEFFPVEFSPFGYNATTVQEFFPLTKEEVIAKGYNWKEPENNNYKIDIMPEDLPDTIDVVDDTILSKVIGCEHRGECAEACMTAFKIVPNELLFYKRMNLPIPRLCSNCRHFERNKFRNGMKLFHRECMCENEAHGHKGHCPNKFETTYLPDGLEKVYCESCYNKEVY